MTPFLIGVSLGLVLVAVLATGAVVGRLAAYIRSEGWVRLTTQQRLVGRKERELFTAARRCTCGACARSVTDLYGE